MVPPHADYMGNTYLKVCMSRDGAVIGKTHQTIPFFYSTSAVKNVEQGRKIIYVRLSSIC